MGIWSAFEIAKFEIDDIDGYGTEHDVMNMMMIL